MARCRSIVAFACFALTSTASLAQDPLLHGFQNPPDSAKPQTWWHWINGNISKAGITADLEAMKKVGIGGAEIFNVDVGIPAGRTPFMSPQWNDAIAHAIRESKRLGMDLCVHNGAGWSSSGGPWIKPEYAMQFLTWSETPLHGPMHFEAQLPQGPTKEGFYRDIAVYALRKPKNDAFRIANIRVKAGFDRGDRILPDLKPNAAGAVIAGADVHLLPVGAGGAVTWSVPAGDWIIVRMGYTPTGEGNHPAPASGYGLEVDKLSRTALDTHWAGMVASVIKDAGGDIGNPGLNDILIDSYEVGSQNWTPRFREDFRKRRGYDPLPYLAVVTGRVIGSLEASERFLWDMRRTICDLFAENYYGYFTELCHKHGLKFSDEGYGNGSFDNLQVCGAADIPMGEFWVGGGTLETLKLASSAGHIYGRPIVGAESFTADTPHGRWMTDPYSLKALGDRAFSLGINRFIFHRYAMQPWLDVLPGMTMGPWGTHFDRTETWWEQSAAWMKYLARSQFLLQSGRMVADVAAYTGEEGPNDIPLMGGNPIPAGYDYDGLDAASLMKMHVENGQLVLPSGMRYRMLLLPNSTWMTPHIAQKIADLVHAGAVVLGPKPLRSPSLGDMGRGDATVAHLGALVWGSQDIRPRTQYTGPSTQDPRPKTRNRYGAGWAYSGETVSKVLSDTKCSQDFDLVQGWDLNWLHRQLGSGAESPSGPRRSDVYFIANPRYVPGSFEVSLRVAGKQPEIWDPETGQTHPIDVYVSKGGRTQFPLRLEAAGSVFVVFRKPAQGSHLVSLTHEGSVTLKEILPKIVITSARYDADDGQGGADVTATVRAMVSHGVTEIAATNGNFGDPAINHRKHLKVVFTVAGKPFDRTAGENDTLQLVGTSGSDWVRPDYTVEDGKLLAWSPGVYTAVTSTGRTVKFHAPPAAKVAIPGPWTLSFPPDLGAPPSVTLSSLISWPDSDNPGVKYFSGSATYRTTFGVPASALKPGFAPYLDLGRVKNIAEVWLNGKLQPALWKAPFRLAAKGLKAGRNELVVRVTNLWPNRLIGDEQLPPEVESKQDGSIAVMPDWALDLKPRPKGERITFTTWNFFKKDATLLESGLLGPVSIVFVPVMPLRR